ncbi:MAG: cofactor-independent phosphoglycerate mutase [Chloroflexota bacterium]
MKYCVVILDGAAGYPLPERGNKTSLELARTPNLDAMATEGMVGLARTIPPGMEASSDNACLSILGYDPRRYHQGRAAIEAVSMGITTDGAVVFRANLVTVEGGRMRDYSAGHILTDEARLLIGALNDKIGENGVYLYPGVSYRHILKLKGHDDTLLAHCTPAHDIPGKPVEEFLPRGIGSELLREIMECSVPVLADHPVNTARSRRGELPATMLWLFWGSGKTVDVPDFKRLYGVKAAVTSAVDVLRGLVQMMGMAVLEIPGVKDGLDNDFSAQAKGALDALKTHDLVVIHIEATDEAAHCGSVEDKVAAIERTDSEVLGQVFSFKGDSLRVLVTPDHPTPIATRTHSPDPVPFLIWGAGLNRNGAKRLTEVEGKATGFFMEDGYNIMGRLITG